jgi:hypothetical protein
MWTRQAGDKEVIYSVAGDTKIVKKNKRLDLKK